MPAEALQWRAEYRYRKLFGLSHAEYLDEPYDAIRWALHIDDIEQDITARRQHAANGMT